MAESKFQKVNEHLYHETISHDGRTLKWGKGFVPLYLELKDVVYDLAIKFIKKAYSNRLELEAYKSEGKIIRLEKDKKYLEDSLLRRNQVETKDKEKIDKLVKKVRNIKS